MIKKEKAYLVLKKLKLKLKMINSKNRNIDSNKIIQKKKDKKQLFKLNHICKK